MQQLSVTTSNISVAVTIYMYIKLHTYLAHCNCAKFRPGQMSACTRPLYRPRLDQGFANTKQSFVVSAQHTLDALQNTIGLVSYCSRFVSVKALSVYGKYCTTAHSQRASIRVAKSAFIFMNTRNLHPDSEDRRGRKKESNLKWITKQL